MHFLFQHDSNKSRSEVLNASGSLWQCPRRTTHMGRRSMICQLMRRASSCVGIFERKCAASTKSSSQLGIPGLSAPIATNVNWMGTWTDSAVHSCRRCFWLVCRDLPRACPFKSAICSESAQICTTMICTTHSWMNTLVRGQREDNIQTPFRGDNLIGWTATGTARSTIYSIVERITN